MARRKTNGLKIALIGSAALFLAIVGVVGFVIFGKTDDFRGLPPFPVDSYLGGSNLWSYDEYRLEGRIDNVIYRSRSSDRIVASVQPLEAKVRLPVVIEPRPGAKSVQIEQMLELKVSLGPDREILCRDYRSR